MTYVVSSRQMKKLDQKTIRECAMPSSLLMENAGRACTELLINEYPAYLTGQILVCCGPGNNGGDGAVIARWLAEYGYKVCILMPFTDPPATSEAKNNFALCKRAGVPIIKIGSVSSLPRAQEAIKESSLIIDALFGIGFHGEPKRLYSDLFRMIAVSDLPVVAIDIPSGLDADTGTCFEALKCDLCISIEAHKLGLFLGVGRYFWDRLALVKIGIPTDFFKEELCAELITESNCLYPCRNPLAHKGDFGRVEIIAGSPGYTGAAVMACQAALRAGAGYVFLHHRPGLEKIFEIKLTEAMSFAIPTDSISNLPDTEAFLTRLNKASAILIGPGLGTDAYALKLLETVLKKCKTWLVLDADALNLMAKNPKLMTHLSKENILITPHIGEFSRLSGCNTQTILVDTLSCLQSFIKKYGCRVLLKSSTSIYADENCMKINISGNDGLATGGSGDVLSGIITSFLAQEMEVSEAAISASYLMGRTAEQLARTRKAFSILPTDILDSLFKEEF
ncbi:MAG: NAD(P)H-hydrate dehydratase [Candidatus Cloacimonetes bacterium]|nr:NAD(P)H-hydrate dehydratase [Candidatus Cloacimonadota bacterium]